MLSIWMTDGWMKCFVWNVHKSELLKRKIVENSKEILMNI